MTTRPSITVVVLLVLIAGMGAAFRLTSKNWGSDSYRLPAEEEFNHLVNTLEYPSSVQEYLESPFSPLNPFVGSRDLSIPVYGSLPASLSKVFRSKTETEDANRARSSGRSLSAWADVVVLILVAFTGFRAFSIRVGMLAATLYALFPVGIFNSHQMTTGWAAIVPNVLLLSAVLPSREKGVRRASVVHFLVFGILFGAASALDPRNLLLAALLPFLFLIRGMSKTPQGGGIVPPESHPIGSPLVYSVIALLSTWISWRLFQPYAFVPGTLIEFSGDFVESGAKILLSELPKLPPLQSIELSLSDRAAKVFDFTVWGFGPMGGIALLLILSIGILPRAVLSGDFRVITLGTVVFSFLALVLMQKYPDPGTLHFAAPAAALLIADFAISLFADQRLTLCFVEGGMIAASLYAAGANVELYQKQNPRDRASQWIVENLQQGKTLLVEARSVRLPGPIGGRIPGPYRFSEFDPLTPRFAQKDRFFEAQLQKTDMIALSSSAIADYLRERRGEAPEFYHRLENGELVFEERVDFQCRSKLLTWDLIERWVPPEVRFPNCPQVNLYPRKAP